MRERRWIAVLALLMVGALTGAAAIIASTEINRYTSTDAFCTSCHTMASIADDPQYKRSAHRMNAAGVLAGCSDCHIPTSNWFVETYTHVAHGIADLIAEKTHNFGDPAVWNARRVELANRARDAMRRDGGAACRKCHEVAAIRPVSGAGRAVHAAPAQGGLICIDCHANLVHAPPAATPR
jgi:nitrate/TMAO reductase-like tetraheme cytochrome c subunit